jgi:hypothetical protein
MNENKEINQAMCCHERQYSWYADGIKGTGSLGSSPGSSPYNFYGLLGFAQPLSMPNFLV